eukprot:TRINITY_DN29150_c0_g6_i1.p1 TRINITY_DN29150_c0_g6~~TRINITY_DN29150_c0_g6_i1.p1  ORF type:complete len:219 (-),score=4.93 TRINITY_DN29150_c0_g6_i1:1010-1666(-)
MTCSWANDEGCYEAYEDSMIRFFEMRGYYEGQLARHKSWFGVFLVLVLFLSWLAKLGYQYAVQKLWISHRQFCINKITGEISAAEMAKLLDTDQGPFQSSKPSESQRLGRIAMPQPSATTRSYISSDWQHWVAEVTLDFSKCCGIGNTNYSVQIKGETLIVCYGNGQCHSQILEAPPAPFVTECRWFVAEQTKMGFSLQVVLKRIVCRRHSSSASCTH